MNNKSILLRSFLNGAGALVYIALVVSLMYNSSNLFADDKSFFIPVFMLLLFVISATITGFLVLGKPILLYIEGEKKNGYSLLVSTIAWLVIFLVVVSLFILK